MEVLYGEVEKVLRGVVEVDAVLFVAEEVAGPDISDKGSEVLPTSIILFEGRSSDPYGRRSAAVVSHAHHPSYSRQGNAAI